MNKLNVLKRNRKFFKVTVDGYVCKLLIDGNSETLIVGEYSLPLVDISKRTKYGTEVIYKLQGDVEEAKAAGVITLEHRYNVDLVNTCRNLGGGWDKWTQSWVFSCLVADKVEELDEKYNGDIVAVELTLLDAIHGHQGPALIAGYPVAKAYDRDSGATVSEGVVLIEGEVSSGGSRKNWHTEVSEGAILRMEISKNLISEIDTEEVSVKILDVIR